MSTDWDAFFDPKVVCVVGASGDPSRIGGRLVRYSLESGFTGRVIPVNPNRDNVFGIATRASLSEVEESPDWVVIALPRDLVPDAVEQAGQIGARCVSIVASGFAETGEAGQRLQAHVAQTARRYRMRLLGPNSNGFMNPVSGAYFAFTPVIDSARPVAGEIAVVTQSAAIGTYLVNWCRRIGLGIRYWVHTGNEADVTALEVARELALRGEVKAVALCFEVLRDMEDLRGTLHTLAQSGIATGVLQAGVSRIGKRASQAHTAALIGAEADLLGDLASSAGAYVASTVAGLINVIQLAVNHPGLPVEPRLGFVSTSGGVGVLMADAAEAQHIPLPPLSVSLQERIRSYAPFSHPANPIDTTAQVINEPEAFARILRDCADSGELDMLAVFIAHGLAGAHDPTLRQLLAAASSGRPGTALSGLGIFSAEAAGELQRAGVNVFSEPADLTAALRGYADMLLRRSAFAAQPAPQPLIGGAAAGVLDEVAAKRLLREAGADVVAGEVVADAEAAVAVAERLGYPVVAKLVSPSVPHKAAQGGVRLHLWTPEMVSQAFKELDALGSRIASDHTILVEKQVSGIEVFVSRVRHRRLGPLVGIGPGGTGVEQARGVRWQWEPVGPQQIQAVLPGAHAAALVRLVAAMARVDLPMIEVNPVILTEDGAAVVVDALAEGSA